MTTVPPSVVSKLVENMHQPPLTDKFEKINFKNMNVFSKIQALPNFKNKNITKEIRKIFRTKDKIDPHYFLIKPKLIEETKEAIEKDFFISNYRFKALNRNKKLNKALFELNMKRKGHSLERVEEDQKESDADQHNSPYLQRNHILNLTGYNSRDGYPLKERVLPGSTITNGDLIKNCRRSLERLQLDEAIDENFRINRHVQEGQRLTLKDYRKRIKFNPYLSKFHNRRRSCNDGEERNGESKGVLDMNALRHLRSKERVERRDQQYLKETTTDKKANIRNQSTNAWRRARSVNPRERMKKGQNAAVQKYGLNASK